MRTALENKRARFGSAGVALLIVMAGFGAVVPVLGAAGTRVVPVVLPGLSLARYLGPASPSESRTIGIGIRPPDPAGEQQLYDAIYDPRSPLYHHFLTPARFAARFGVSSVVSRRITGWLRAGGLAVDTDSPTGTYITATGSIEHLNRLFSVQIGRYDIGGIAFLANDRMPRVPSELPIAAVVGLDTLQRFYLPKTSSIRTGIAGALKHAVLPAAGTFSGVLQPRDLWRLYNMPSTDLGQGQTMGVFGMGQTASVVSNLRLFEKQEGFPRVPVRVVRTQPGGDAAYSDTSGNVEWYLDTQSSTGMAPKIARLDLYFSRGFLDADVFASFKRWVDDPIGPRQMNASFGECETNPTNPITGPLGQFPAGTGLGNRLEPIAEPILRQATLEGRTLFASTGDTGSGCPAVVLPVLGAGNGVVLQPLPSVGYPAASPFVVAVGGTIITTDGTNHGVRRSEVAWTFTGGGPSQYIPVPRYQRSVQQVNRPCISRPDGTPYASLTTCRGIPDVSALSGNITGNGFSIIIDGRSGSSGGTSLSSPLMMGIWARLQAAASSRAGLGFANETFYRQGTGPHRARDFFDVTAAETPLGNGLYQPGPGWDYTTGWGVPDVGHLLDDVVHTRVARRR